MLCTWSLHQLQITFCLPLNYLPELIFQVFPLFLLESPVAAICMNLYRVETQCIISIKFWMGLMSTQFSFLQISCIINCHARVISEHPQCSSFYKFDGITCWSSVCGGGIYIAAIECFTFHSTLDILTHQVFSLAALRANSSTGQMPLHLWIIQSVSFHFYFSVRTILSRCFRCSRWRNFHWQEMIVHIIKELSEWWGECAWMFGSHST